MVAYAALADLKARLEITDAAQDALLNGLLEQVARFLDGECERDFFRHPTLAVDPAETRIIRTTGRSRRVAVRDGMITVSSVETATSPAGTYTAVAATDYAFDPYELPPEETHEHLLLVPTSAYRKWPEGYVRIVGHFGFAAVPRMIVDANLDGARELYRQGPGGGGPIGVTQFGTPIFNRGMPKSVLDAIDRYAWRDFSHV